MMNARSLVRAVAAWMVFVAGSACDTPSLPARTVIDEPQRLSFRCVTPTDRETGAVEGLPLEGCGCTRRTGDDPDAPVEALGRVECACRVLLAGPGERSPCANGLDDDGDGDVDAEDVDCVPVESETGFVRPTTGEAASDVCRNALDDDGDGVADLNDPGCVTGEGTFQEATVRRLKAACSGPPEARECDALRHPSSGDFIPEWDPDARDVVACAPAGEGLVRGYVGASGRGEVAIVDLTEQHRILDVDRSIPGSTSIYVDDLVSDVESDPDGRFVFTVNSSTGTLSIVRNDDVSVAYVVDLGTAPLLQAWTDPPEVSTRPREGELRRRPVAFITAPLESTILEVSLDALHALAPEAAGARVDGREAILRRIPLRAVDDAGVALGGDAPRPGVLGLDPTGEVLFVGHVDTAAVQVIDRDEPERQRSISLFPAPCADAYLTDVLDLRTAGICSNGRDDDGDGAIDMEDPDCRAGHRWEAGRAPSCPRLARCADGVDDDADGLVDAEDPDCVNGWERAVPACSNLQDDDGDGRIDRADPDCANEEDDDERGQERSTCNDDLDNDGNGVADGQDPACRVEQCDDAEDNDGDGAADLDDDDCATSEARLAQTLPEEGETEGSACANGDDDDGDGLADVEDPGCRFLSADRRFTFEVRPECGNGVDDDGDGLVDHPEDPDCVFAADSSEASGRTSAGPASLAAVRYDLGGGVGGLAAYVVDRETGTLFGIDLGAGEPLEASAEVRRIELPAGAQAVIARQTESGASLLLTDADASLRTVEVTAPQPVTDQSGRPVFARVVPNPDTADSEHPYVIGAFYVVASGRAWRVPMLDPWIAATGGKVFTEEQRARIARRLPIGLLSLPLPAVVRSEVTLDGKAPNPQSVLDGDDDVSPRGQVDPAIVLSGARRLLQTQTNILTTAATRTNRIAQVPALEVGQSAGLQFDASIHPAFCRPSALDDDDRADCVPVGREADGTPEDPEDTRARTRFDVEPVVGITVIEDDPEKLPVDRFTLAYEGVIPGTDSRSGQHGGVTESDDGDTWALLDYDRDFCRAGIEVGDVVLVERFVPVIDTEEALPAVCRDLRNRAETQRDPARFRDPIRYTVRDLTAHRLTLGAGLPGVDQRTSFGDMVQRDVYTAHPSLPEPPPVPLPACAAQFLRYRVRVADDSWLLSGDRSGMRHPWTSRDGRCERVASRANRTSRVVLGEPFANEWFAFTLGWLAAPENASAGTLGVPAGLRPYQLDVRYVFDTVAGISTRSLQGELALPRDLRWLPVDDRLYVVDSALGTLVEFTGFDPYEQVLRAVRQFN